MTTHVLRTHPQHFRDVKSGAKPYELRRNDRGFKVGDRLHLVEYDPEGGYTGATHNCEVIHVLRNAPEFGLMPGFAVLGVR